MSLNIDEYLQYTEKFDLTDEEKKELIRTVWSYMESRVDKAYKVHPIQQCRGYSNENNLQSPEHKIGSKQVSLNRDFTRAGRNRGQPER